MHARGCTVDGVVLAGYGNIVSKSTDGFVKLILGYRDCTPFTENTGWAERALRFNASKYSALLSSRSLRHLKYCYALYRTSADPDCVRDPYQLKNGDHTRIT